MAVWNKSVAATSTQFEPRHAPNALRAMGDAGVMPILALAQRNHDIGEVHLEIDHTIKTVHGIPIPPCTEAKDGPHILILDYGNFGEDFGLVCRLDRARVVHRPDILG